MIESLDEVKEPCMKLAVYEEDFRRDSIRYWQERFLINVPSL